MLNSSSNSPEIYKAYELTVFNSSFPYFFEGTFIESGFLWSNQSLNILNCVEVEIDCHIHIFPLLEIGSFESAKVIAETSIEYYGIKYFLASPLTCDIKGYKDSENIYTDRYSVLPHGSCVDFDTHSHNTDVDFGWVACSWMVQRLIWIYLRCTKYINCALNTLISTKCFI